jgi:hypothetical protein
MLDGAADLHSISVEVVTAPLTLEPSFSLSVSTPLVNDITVPALGAGVVDVPGDWASLVPKWRIRACARW